MRLFAVGISHRTAPVELREASTSRGAGSTDALAALAARGVTREAVVLSTCNRAEIYAGAESDAAAARVRPLRQRLPRRRRGTTLAPHVFV